MGLLTDLIQAVKGIVNAHLEISVYLPFAFIPLLYPNVYPANVQSTITAHKMKVPTNSGRYLVTHRFLLLSLIHI